MEKGKIKVLWLSDIVVPTGFSRVAHSIISRLSADKYDITVLGVNYWGDPHEYPFRIYPAGISEQGDIYGASRLPGIVKKEKPDIIFMLNDIWILQPYLKVLKEVYAMENAPPKPKIVIYFPVDGSRHDFDWYTDMDIVDRAVVYTEFGKKVASIASPKSTFEIIPHGVDTQVFSKLTPTRADMRDAYFDKTIERRDELLNSFIILNANRNQPRKKVDITIEAFTIFAREKSENVYLYLHMGAIDSHINIHKFLRHFDIERRVIMTSKKVGNQTVPDKKLNHIYNICDIGVNTSTGEGWGLVNMEHAVTGAPQVVPNHTVNYEFYNDCGLLVEPVTRITTEYGTVGQLVRAEDVAEQFEKLYTDRVLLADLAQKSITKFSSHQYSWENVASMWDKLFTEVMS